jgi:hypothetical protein
MAHTVVLLKTIYANRLDPQSRTKDDDDCKTTTGR